LEPRLLLAADVLTYHNDNGLTGQNLSETILTPANVDASDFGKLFTDTVDGAVFAQPLVKSGVVVPGRGTRNLVFVATEHDSVYAFDADNPGTPVWHDSFINPAAGVTTVPDTDINTSSLGPEVGITGTPVIDPSSNTLYVVAFTKEVSGGKTSYVQRLHALDIATGAEKFGGPVAIQAAVPGTGPGSSGGVVSFDAFHQNQRPGLLLDNGIVYIAWASFADHTPYHGWVIGYNGGTLHQAAVFNSTPDGGLGGIWESGAAPAADAAGNLYVVTGNGTFDASSASAPNDDYGDSFLKLSGGAGGLTPTSSFTPFNQALLDANDEDLGSGGVVVLPDQPGPHPHLLIGAGKEGKIYVLNRDSLGGFDPSTDHVVQEVPGGVTSAFATPAYFNGHIYYGGVGDSLKAFDLTNGVLATGAASQSSEVFGYPGTTPSISANGTAGGVVWAVENSDTAVLRAYAADNLGTELYDSNQAGTRDQPGKAIKFEVPTVVNGKVYIGVNGGLAVFGLIPGTTRSPYGLAGVFVTQAYEDLLGRTPDPVGLAGWSGLLNQGLITRNQLAQALAGSVERDTLEVQQVYTRFLHRSPDPKGLMGWTDFLQGGGSLAGLEAGVVGSEEYFQLHGGTNGAFLGALYQDALGRILDATGQQSWEPLLDGGASRDDVAAAIFGSQEYSQDLVRSYYQEFLHRPADSTGLDGWVAAIRQGLSDAQILAGFVGSVEYLSRLP
jgi:hypothetical protein